jgi:cyanophycin synthetase
MVLQKSSELVRINARRTDVFDIFNFKHYLGPNPYLDVGALVFDFALIDSREPLPVQDYIASIAPHRYPNLGSQTYESHAHLFAEVVSEVGKLDMDLHFNHWSVKPYPNCTRISIQSLHERTTKEVVYFVWDWFEAITQDEDFTFDEQLVRLQNKFRASVYGGPTVYALLRTAYEKGIPTFYLWEEGLMQYGLGKKHIRGVATTFNCDSHLDSEFTTRKDDCKAFLKTLGFPVPEGNIVFSEKEALAAAREIGYPVAVKPVVGHKGIGVTAEVQDSKELVSAYNRALAAIPEDQLTRIIVEKSIFGSDFRLLCVNGRFVAATERRIDHILLQHPNSTIGAVCRDAVFVNRSKKVLSKDYNSNVQTLLRHPKLDLLIAEYGEDILEEQGMFYQSSNIVVLDNPTETEMILMRDVFDSSTVVIRKGNGISIRRKGLIEDYTLGEDEPFTRVYLKETGAIL